MFTIMYWIRSYPPITKQTMTNIRNEWAEWVMAVCAFSQTSPGMQHLLFIKTDLYPPEEKKHIYY